MWCLIFALLSSGTVLAERLAHTSGGSGARIGKAPYCDENRNKSGSTNCKVDTILQKGGWNKDQASEFTKKCPQQCKDFRLITRTEWGHPNPDFQICNPEEKSQVMKLARLKKLERTTYCAAGDVVAAAAITDNVKSEVKKMKDGKEPNCLVDMDGTPSSIVIHHSEGPSVNPDGTFTGPKDLLKFYTEHGWSDSPYHYIVARDASGRWQVFEGRGRLKGDKCKWLMGGHVGPGANDGSLGVVIVGNYSTAEENPAGEQPLGSVPPEPGAMARLIQLIAQLKKECPGIKKVEGHGEARARAYGCETNGKIDLSKGNCAEENKGTAGRAGCYKACPGSGCSLIPGDIHQRVIDGR